MKKLHCNKEKEQALRCFMRNERRKVFCSLARLVDSAQAEDIFQDAIFKIFQLAEQNPAAQSFFDKLDMLKPMLFTIAKNRAISEIRHCKVEEQYRIKSGSSNNDNKASLESAVIHDDHSKQLLDAINQLPPICRQVFVQRKLNGKSHAQIATMLGISTKTVEGHISKGLKFCREHLLKRQSEQGRNGKRKAG